MPSAIQLAGRYLKESAVCRCKPCLEHFLLALYDMPGFNACY